MTGICCPAVRISKKEVKPCKKLAREAFGGACCAEHQAIIVKYNPDGGAAYAEVIFGDIEVDPTEAAALHDAVSTTIANAMATEREARLAALKQRIMNAKGHSAVALTTALKGDTIVGAKRIASAADIAQAEASAAYKSHRSSNSTNHAVAPLNAHAGDEGCSPNDDDMPPVPFGAYTARPPLTLNPVGDYGCAPMDADGLPNADARYEAGM